MIGYVTLGTNKFDEAAAFYDALLAEIGAKRLWDSTDFVAWGVSPTQPSLGIIKPHNKQPATVGNGSMTAFRTQTHAMVRSVHAAGLEAGGTDEGAPGFRDDYSDNFYVGYLRDPLGNKVAIFCANPAEGRRGG